MKIKTIGGICGCPTCTGNESPNSRAGWKAKRNKHGRGYGTHVKGGRSRGQRKQV